MQSDRLINRTATAPQHLQNFRTSKSVTVSWAATSLVDPVQPCKKCLSSEKAVFVLCGVGEWAAETTLAIQGWQSLAKRKQGIATETSLSAPKHKAVAGAAVLLAAAAAAYFAQGHSAKDAIQTVETTVTAAGSAGPFIFIASYAIATVVLVPASALTLAAGFLYGPVTGTAIVSAASTLGATLAFLVSRYLARPFVLRKLQDYPKLAAVQSKVSLDGANVVFLLRLSPLVPFTLLNYALGVTEVPLASYVGTSWAGMLPGTIAYVYLGSTGRSATGVGSGNFDTIKFGLYAVGAVATLLMAKLVADRASAALEDEDLKES